MDTATYHAYGSDVEQVRAQATRHFAAYFAGRPFEIVDTSADAVLTIGGALLHWDVRVEARALTAEVAR